MAFVCMIASPRHLSAEESAVVQARVPVADFFRPPMLAYPALSPSGRYLAGAVTIEGKRAQLVVLDLENLGQLKHVADFQDADIYSYQWVNDERIVFDVSDRESGAGRPLAPGLWAVNRDGSNYRQLISTFRNVSRARMLPWEWRLHSVLSDGSNEVLVQGFVFNNAREVIGTKLARLDTMTGMSRSLGEGAPSNVTRWLVDRQGRPTVVTTLQEGRFRAFVKADADATWETWQDADALLGNYVFPYWIGFDRQLLVLARRVDDTWALHAVDTKTRALDPVPIIHLKGYDFRGSMVSDTEERRLLGVHYETDARGTVWFDPLMKAIQADVDARLPGTVNRIDCRRCVSVPTVLVTAASDRQPPNFYVYNRDTKSMTLISASRPWIKAPAMGLRDVHRVAARDGLSIPVLVTTPAGKPRGPLPAVVLVHGGPWVRGTHWDWEPQAQFLASRGYMVIEPEFRGSEGYGFKLFRAGWKQWGLAMQDDVADVVEWAVKQGWVDSKRICIAGASYGGYAVLMGLIRNHDLYQCGIAWVAVTDINLMYSIQWSDTSEEAKNYSMPLLVGDVVADAGQFKETSPVEQAAKVRRPLLLAYGGADVRVPIKHGHEFRDAVGRTNKDVQWVTYPEEGHGWRMLETQVDFWTRVEKFLDRYLGPAAK
jgi:dipeptidyl aminopeptidase/acylaminoacyl peptidase